MPVVNSWLASARSRSNFRIREHAVERSDHRQAVHRDRRIDRVGFGIFARVAGRDSLIN